ncbi:MAG: hypothetical protein ACK4V1_12990 [Burkholderiaceae bacterium]
MRPTTPPAMRDTDRAIVIAAASDGTGAAMRARSHETAMTAKAKGGPWTEPIAPRIVDAMARAAPKRQYPGSTA